MASCSRYMSTGSKAEICKPAFVIAHRFLSRFDNLAKDLASRSCGPQVCHDPPPPRDLGVENRPSLLPVYVVRLVQLGVVEVDQAGGKEDRAKDADAARGTRPPGIALAQIRVREAEASKEWIQRLPLLRHVLLGHLRPPQVAGVLQEQHVPVVVAARGLPRCLQRAALLGRQRVLEQPAPLPLHVRRGLEVVPAALHPGGGRPPPKPRLTGDRCRPGLLQGQRPVVVHRGLSGIVIVVRVVMIIIVIMIITIIIIIIIT